MDLETGAEFEHSESLVRRNADTEALLEETTLARKPFYRPRPLWLVPFALTAAITRGMTLAPRVEIFTQLSCNRLHGNAPYNHTELALSPQPSLNLPDALSPLYSSLDPLGPHLDLSYTSQVINFDPTNHQREDDPRHLPSPQCLGDATVQAGAAQIQTIMATTSGLLSALTTSYWGRFSERHGRTKVLAIATFGLFLTDMTFILVSTPSSPMSSHGHKFLLFAPIVEGSLGGWSALQSAASAYLSDCTSNGSRALIFSRFSGVYSFGLAIGPIVGGYLIRYPVWKTEDGAPSVTSVFWVAIIGALLNFILVLFVFPESLDKIKRDNNSVEQAATISAKGKRIAREEGEDQPIPGGPPTDTRRGLLGSLLRPLSVFLPVTTTEGTRKRTDWSLTFLGCSFFIYMLSLGLYQVKYLYATHTYEWGAEQLSYYISFLGGIRTLFLLFIIPWVITTFKPKPQPKSQALSNGQASVKALKVVKPKPTRSYLTQEIKFDLRLARLSFILEMLSHIFVVTSPLQTYYAHGHHKSGSPSYHSKEESQAYFVMATSFASLGGGSMPAIQSLALSILQLRGLNAASSGHRESGKEKVGELFGALAVLGAVGSGIIAPIMFGLIYSGTVAAFPRTIFVAGAAFILVSILLLTFVKAPGTPFVGRSKGKKKYVEPERGRSRVSKDLRGGLATSYGTMAGPSTSASAASSYS